MEKKKEAKNQPVSSLSAPTWSLSTKSEDSVRRQSCRGEGRYKVAR